jgi:hypothetical protein
MRPGGMGPGGMGPGGMAGGMMGGRPRGPLTRDDGYKLRLIPIAQLAKESNVKPKEDIQPVRMVEIVASFPYKKQLEEFQRALLLKSLGEVLAGPDAAQFRGFEVQRTEFKPDKAEKWETINLEQAWVPLMLETGRETEEDPPQLVDVSFDGLVMHKLRQCREGQYPPLELGDERNPDKYPGLKHLKATIDQLQKDKRGPIAKPTNPFKEAEGVSIFDKGAPTQGNTAGGGGGLNIPGNVRPPVGVTPAGMAGTGTGTGSSGQDVTVPEYCLVRFFDPTVQPGKTYKYRVRIRMANPNYGKEKEVVGPSMSKDKDLLSDPFELPEPVAMPQELHYYAVDMKVQEKVENSKNHDFSNYLPADQIAAHNQVPVQIQRWLETLYDMNPNSKSSNLGFPVGDWVIADRTLLTRGEYIGRTADTEVPIWDPGHDVFTLANFRRYGPRSRNNLKVPVFFGQSVGPDPGPEDPILVDFRGGTQMVYERYQGLDDNSNPQYKPIKDPSTSTGPSPALEVLLLSPDGKLVLHDGIADAGAYKDRYDQVKQRLTETKNQKQPTANPNRTTTNPFDK